MGYTFHELLLLWYAGVGALFDIINLILDVIPISKYAIIWGK